MPSAKHPLREDQELRAVIAAALIGLGRPVGQPPPRRDPRAFRDLVIPILGCLILIALLVHPVLASYLASQPAFLSDTNAHVDGGSAVPPAGHFLITVVATRSADGRSAVAATRAMDESRRNALAVAIGCVGSRASRHESVEIKSQRLRGPSAGLMFALTVVDLLMPEDITQGRRIAGTGTISRDGDVGAIGELPLKARAAQRENADLFLVPASQAPEARRYVTRLPIVGVGSLDEALRALGARGCSA